MRQPRRPMRHRLPRNGVRGVRAGAGTICTARLDIQAEAAVLAGQETRSPSFKKVGELGTPSVCALGDCPQMAQRAAWQSSRAAKPHAKGLATNAVPGSIESAVARLWRSGYSRLVGSGAQRDRCSREGAAAWGRLARVEGGGVGCIVGLFAVQAAPRITSEFSRQSPAGFASLAPAADSRVSPRQ